MKARISMITLGVADMEKAVRFYEIGLGLPRMPFEGGPAFFMLNGSWLSLHPWAALAEDATVEATGSGFRGITLAHVVSSKEEVLGFSIKLPVLEEKSSNLLKTYFGVVTQDISPTLMDISGK